MIPPRVLKYMSPRAAGLGGIAGDGMKLNIQHDVSDYAKTSVFTVSLYINDSVRDHTADSLDIMLRHFSDSPWFPSSSGTTLEEAFSKLEEKLSDADLYTLTSPKDNWFGMVYSVAYQFTQLEDEDKRYAFDYDGTCVYKQLSEID